jgi:hypothetical protein
LPPYYIWNIEILADESRDIYYKVKPKEIGKLYIGPTSVTTSFDDIYYSNPVTVNVFPIYNGICEPEKSENYLNSPQDCPSGSLDGICDLAKDGVCDPDCEEDADIDCTETKKNECGNGVCEPEEDSIKCAEDCNTVQEPVCGNGICNLDEDPMNCPEDCPEEKEDIICGNLICEKSENKENCPEDCPVETMQEDNCGDAFCDEEENYFSCKQDCPSGSSDGYCDGLLDNTCDIDCIPGQDPDCKEKGSKTGLIIVLILVVLLIIVISGIIIIRKKGSPAYQETQQNFNQ